MNILVLGGTGAMGVPLVRQLSSCNDVFVTTRQKRINTIDDKRIIYIQGNAKDLEFLKVVLQLRQWDVIVDFMVWTSEYEIVANLMLSNTRQYVFISSARVYASSNSPITESTPRLLDVSNDEDYLRTNEYALAKAREEDLLIHSGSNNYTIIRPTITYNNQRLQLGVLEKENWLYRVLQGRSIVFSKDIAGKITTMTYGSDVAKGIVSIIGRKEAMGEVFNVTSPYALKWDEVLNVYLDVLEKHLGKRPNVVMTEKSLNLNFKSKVYQVIYSRLFNRSFDNKKISQFCDVDSFVEPSIGLKKCLEQFLQSPSFQSIDWGLEALNDRAAREFTPLSEMPSRSSRLEYLRYRYNLVNYLFLIRGAAVRTFSFVLDQLKKEKR